MLNDKNPKITKRDKIIKEYENTITSLQRINHAFHGGKITLTSIDLDYLKLGIKIITESLNRIEKTIIQWKGGARMALMAPLGVLSGWIVIHYMQFWIKTPHLLKVIMGKFKVQLGWRDEKITDKQREVIIKLKEILGYNTKMPTTKGKASDLISKMVDEFKLRLDIYESSISVDDIEDLFNKIMKKNLRDLQSDHEEDRFSIY